MSIRLELEADKSGAMQPTSPTLIAPSKIHDLPQDVFYKIFSYLSKNDLQAVACVNWSMHNFVKKAANFNEIESIKNFIQILFQRLNTETFPMQKQLLMRISQTITFKNFANLVLLKKYILVLKAELINVIKTLDLETANNLKGHVQPPHFLENIFELAAFERQIYEANLISDKDCRGEILRDISKALAEAGNIDRAIEVASSIPSGKLKAFEHRASAFYNISKALVQAGNMDRAIEIAMSIPNKCRMWRRESAFRNVSKALVQASNIDRAIESAMSISIGGMKESELSAMSISSEEAKDFALYDISKALVEAGNIDRAIEVAMSIPDESRTLRREDALCNISKALIEAGNMDRAIETAKMISKETRRMSALSDISKTLAEAGNTELLSKLEF